MIILGIVAIISVILFAVGFVVGVCYFIGWVIASIFNDNDYGASSAHKTE